MKKLVLILPAILVTSVAFGQTARKATDAPANARAQREAYKPTSYDNLYGGNKNNRNNPDAGQSAPNNYGYNTGSQSKTYNDAKVNGNTGDQKHPSVLEEERKRDEYNAELKKERKP